MDQRPQSSSASRLTNLSPTERTNSFIFEIIKLGGEKIRPFSYKPASVTAIMLTAYLLLLILY